MFTGIIQTQAKIAQITKDDGIVKLVINVKPQYATKLEIGASIAINGCCLTVTEFKSILDGVEIHFDIIDETLALTNLNDLVVGHRVNFERSMTFGKELGGHIVSGHIHCKATIASRINEGNNCKIKLNVPANWKKYVLYKGFIAINGASLTVGHIDDEGFWLHLIPETLSITNLGIAQQGDKLNIEVDQQTYTIVNTVENYMQQKG
ncbi:riboflavin synthase subunit alpha [Pseudoalteromonas sp. MMG010]|uniref:riboflavin synthase subunit alpha n=1 Tax=Pseudoalteromonas sp. MMG010 TaxID=2822685 RepID=UPI001B3A5B44|nr:riboflavin synthase subunit alpha [Pseudoalteromonas sp. MMG010]MBQ4832515.1 riboflavin synthase subunit alpha [Pseudoalteromonas sp. MMG010]